MAAPVLLLVDDDPELAAIVGLLARRCGQTLRVCTDVPSAWASLGVEKPDLVLLDVNLPGTDGLALLRGVRASPRLQGLPVALFCQPERSADLAAGWRAGADYLVPKDLVTEVRQWSMRLAEILRHAHGHRPARSLGWPAEGGEVILADWVDLVHRALEHPAVRPLDTEVLREVLHRAVRDSLGQDVPEAALLDVECIMALAFPGTTPTRMVCGFLHSLIDQMRCLLGTEATAPIEEVWRCALIDRGIAAAPR